MILLCLSYRWATNLFPLVWAPPCLGAGFSTCRDSSAMVSRRPAPAALACMGVMRSSNRKWAPCVSSAAHRVSGREVGAVPGPLAPPAVQRHHNCHPLQRKTGEPSHMPGGAPRLVDGVTFMMVMFFFFFFSAIRQSFHPRRPTDLLFRKS